MKPLVKQRQHFEARLLRETMRPQRRALQINESQAKGLVQGRNENNVLGMHITMQEVSVV
jgi:hypothetical protein